MTFWDNLTEVNNRTFTANGSEAYISTGSYLVDFVGKISSYRKSSEDDIVKWMYLLYDENPVAARKLSFYVRDILQGMGERRIARLLWKKLAFIDPDNMKLNIKNIPTFGRFDDLYALIGTPVEADMWLFVKNQFYKDITNMNQNKPVSGLGKWLKSPNSKVKATRAMGRLTAGQIGLENRAFAQALTKLRKYLDVVELKMTDNNWNEIKYQNVPSKAALNYKTAFKKHDATRYLAFLDDVKAGKSNIKANTLYPYDIVKTFFNHTYDDTAELLWKNLPDFITDKSKNILTVCDVSGSMNSDNYTPLSTAIGLTLYLSERTESIFKNKFITFSARPELIKIPDTCDTLTSRIQFTKSRHWGYNTDLAATLDLIADACKLNPKDFPDSLLIITDMQFDSHTTDGWNETLYEHYKNRFEKAGLTMPNIIFWNTASSNYNGAFQTNKRTAGVQYVSGMSPAIFQNVLKNLQKTPYEAVMDIINSERYSVIV